MAARDREPAADPREGAGRRAEARADAAELELERAHHLLDEYGVPREERDELSGRPVDLSLHARIRMVLEEDDDERD